MSRIFFIFLLAIGCFYAATGHAATDTVRIFQYNLLTYGDADNPVSYKNPRLSTIINYAQPDIVGVNELSKGASYSQTVLNSVLGAGWEMGTYSNVSNQIQTNMLFWKTAKFGLARQTLVTDIVRDIIAFKLYYKDPALATTHDTTFVTVIVAHLKAGDFPSDSITRASETQAVVSYLNNLNHAGNYIFMGDMNVYSSNEQCYLNLTTANTNPDTRLFDPVNRPGNWHSNSAFATLHTQSTRTGSLPDGGSGGGIDDRFDNMLVSGPILNNTLRMQYVAGSYKAIGQDGNHMNKSVNAAPTNTAAPAAVVQALYEMSDHLPITADFAFTKLQSNGVATVPGGLDGAVSVSNPFRTSILLHFAPELLNTSLSLRLYNAQGQLVRTAGLTVSGREYRLPVSEVPPGMYLLRVEDKDGHAIARKLIAE